MSGIHGCASPVHQPESEMKNERRKKGVCRNVGYGRSILLLENWQLNSCRLTVEFVHPCTIQQHFLSAFRECGTQPPPPSPRTSSADLLVLHPDHFPAAALVIPPYALRSQSHYMARARRRKIRQNKKKTRQERDELRDEMGRGASHYSNNFFSFPFPLPFSSIYRIRVYRNRTVKPYISVAKICTHHEPCFERRHPASAPSLSQL